MVGLKRKMFLPSVSLSEKEKLVFQVLMDTCRHFQLKTVVRCAGGWVRDKLLSVDSDDIDIAVDSGTGEEFADRVAEYGKLVSKEYKESSELGRTGLREDGSSIPGYASKLEISGIGGVKKNPDKSKHLATACFRICDVELDVTNLRTETYAANSRIPVIEVGTAEEDAFRRDLTINALFYNVNTSSVEDFTNKGLDDLEEGYIRTPLDPVETFRDDPLRVLRVVRFACRYNFAMDPKIIAACGVDDVRGSIADGEKVSKERVGVELGKIMRHKASVTTSYNYFMEGKLMHLVFLVPEFRKRMTAENNGIQHESVESGKEAANSAGSESGSGHFTSVGNYISDKVFHNMEDADSDTLPPPTTWFRLGYLATRVLEGHAKVRGIQLAKDKDLQEILRFAAIYLAFGSKKVKEGKKEVTAIYSLLWNAMVIKKSICDNAAAFAKAALTVFVPLLEGRVDFSDANQRIAIGLALMDRKDEWRQAAYLAESYILAKRFLQEHATSMDVITDDKVTTAFMAEENEQGLPVNTTYGAEMREKTENLIKTITDHGLEGCWTWKPFFTGVDLQKEFNCPKGPLMGETVRNQNNWRFVEPTITKEEMQQKIVEYIQEQSKK